MSLPMRAASRLAWLAPPSNSGSSSCGANDQAPEPALPLAWPADLSPDRLAITEANRAAAAWLAAPGLWPVPVTLVVGPAGSGKTHLARWFFAHHRASVIEGAEAEEVAHGMSF
jgi:chromosomal replication initiation ATPase DnaA